MFLGVYKNGQHRKVGYLFQTKNTWVDLLVIFSLYLLGNSLSSLKMGSGV